MSYLLLLNVPSIAYVPAGALAPEAASELGVAGGLAAGPQQPGKDDVIQFVKWPTLSLLRVLLASPWMQELLVDVRWLADAGFMDLSLSMPALDERPVAHKYRPHAVLARCWDAPCVEAVLEVLANELGLGNDLLPQCGSISVIALETSRPSRAAHAAFAQSSYAAAVTQLMARGGSSASSESDDDCVEQDSSSSDERPSPRTHYNTYGVLTGTRNSAGLDTTGASTVDLRSVVGTGNGSMLRSVGLQHEAPLLAQAQARGELGGRMAPPRARSAGRMSSPDATPAPAAVSSVADIARSKSAPRRGATKSIYSHTSSSRTSAATAPPGTTTASTAGSNRHVTFGAATPPSVVALDKEQHYDEDDQLPARQRHFLARVARHMWQPLRRGGAQKDDATAEAGAGAAEAAAAVTGGIGGNMRRAAGQNAPPAAAAAAVTSARTGNKPRFSETVTSRILVDRLIAQINSGAMLSFDYLMLVLAASILAGVGLVLDSVVVIIASMLVSPIMGPILAITTGLFLGQRDMVIQGVISETAALLVCLLCGFLVSAVASPFAEDLNWPTPEMESRGEATGLIAGVAIAIPSGLGVALSVLGNNTASLVGVAISASLLPPLVNGGISYYYALLGHLSSDLDRDPAEFVRIGNISIALTAVNIVCIIVTTLLVFRFKELVPIRGKSILFTSVARQLRAAAKQKQHASIRKQLLGLAPHKEGPGTMPVGAEDYTGTWTPAGGPPMPTITPGNAAALAAAATASGLGGPRSAPIGFARAANLFRALNAGQNVVVADTAPRAAQLLAQRSRPSTRGRSASGGGPADTLFSRPTLGSPESEPVARGHHHHDGPATPSPQHARPGQTKPPAAYATIGGHAMFVPSLRAQLLEDAIAEEPEEEAGAEAGAAAASEREMSRSHSARPVAERLACASLSEEHGTDNSTGEITSNATAGPLTPTEDHHPEDKPAGQAKPTKPCVQPASAGKQPGMPSAMSGSPTGGAGPAAGGKLSIMEFSQWRRPEQGAEKHSSHSPAAAHGVGRPPAGVGAAPAPAAAVAAARAPAAEPAPAPAPTPAPTALGAVASATHIAAESNDRASDRVVYSVTPDAPSASAGLSGSQTTPQQRHGRSQSLDNAGSEASEELGPLARMRASRRGASSRRKRSKHFTMPASTSSGFSTSAGMGQLGRSMRHWGSSSRTPSPVASPELRRAASLAMAHAIADPDHASEHLAQAHVPEPVPQQYVVREVDMSDFASGSLINYGMAGQLTRMAEDMDAQFERYGSVIPPGTAGLSLPSEEDHGSAHSAGQ